MKIIAYLGVEADMAEGVAASGPSFAWLWLGIGAVVLACFVWAVVSGLMAGR
jgi:hypothetical protein